MRLTWAGLVSRVGRILPYADGLLRIRNESMGVYTASIAKSLSAGRGWTSMIPVTGIYFAAATAAAVMSHCWASQTIRPIIAVITITAPPSKFRVMVKF